MEKEKNCLVVTSFLEGAEQLTIDVSDYGALVCADGGFAVAKDLGIVLEYGSETQSPKIYLIGDYDSGALPTEEEQLAAAGVTVLPTVKDMTDTEAAIDLAVSLGYTHLHVLGGLGGRFDHTMGNLGILEKYCKLAEQYEIESKNAPFEGADPKSGGSVFIVLEDGYNRVRIVAPGKVQVPRSRFQYFGLFAYGGTVEGLTITGARYHLTNFTLTPDTSLCVSNEVAEGAPYAEVSHTSGHLLVIESKDTR